MPAERDYVLGTHDDEVARLGLQHRIWRPRASAAWRRAGFTVGQTVLDVGCGPGYAALDLAEIVGRKGRVVAVDRSRRFLDVLENAARQRGIGHLEAHELDLDEAPLPAVAADGAWVRWVLSFVRKPRPLLERLHHALRPGGTLVLHEYVHYASWLMAPRSRELEAFVGLVIESWRANGGEPDVGLDLPRWLTELDFAIEHIEPIVEVVGPGDYLWQWPIAFIEIGMRRLVDLGLVTEARANEMTQKILADAATPGTWFVTPTVVEIVARRR